MDLTTLIILQIIGHFLADFTFQSEKWAEGKNENGFKSENLKWHILIVFLLSFVLSFQWKFVFASVVIAMLHWLIDGFKKYWIKSEVFKKYVFFLDQILHLVVIVGISILFRHYFLIETFIPFQISIHKLLLILAYLIITKPANILVKEIFEFYEIKISSDGEVAKAGRLIGGTERIIALTLIVLGQYEAVGFIIAGKSILRFKDTDASKTEYVLIGTLLSFGIAILTGIGIQFLEKIIK